MSRSTAGGLLSPLFHGTSLRDVFSDEGRLQAMLDFELALARAQAKLGVIPVSAVPAIAAAARASQYDFDALGHSGASAGNLAIPLVNALRAQVASVDPEAARYVHWGATSQDVIDTGLVLQLRAAFDVLSSTMERLSLALATLASRERATVMPARTWLQQAIPITFGYKAACWLDALGRDRERLQQLRARVLCLQFGGAAGTLAALGGDGLRVAEALAAELELRLPELPWHGARDRVAETGAVFGLFIGGLGKVARDISLLMQSEVGEAFEPAAPGRGGSSTMPQKRNPVGCAIALSAAVRAPALVSTLLAAQVVEHERGLGGWHAEWETLPDLLQLAGGAADAMLGVIEGLEVDADRMRKNLELGYGTLYAESVATALAPLVGRQAAHHVVEQACRAALAQQRHLREIVHEHAALCAKLSPAQIDALFRPEAALGVAFEFIDRALARASAQDSSS